MVCGSRFLTDDSGYPAPISRRTGHPHLRLPAVAHRRPARERPDLGLPALQPPRDRAVRARLPARLPRGRGGADAALPPAADARGAGARCIQRGGGVSSITLRASRPTTWSRCCSRSSSASPARRPVPEPGDAGAGRGGARDLMETRIQIVAIIGSAAAAPDRARAGAPAPAARALRAAVAVQRARAARAGDLARPARGDRHARSASPTRRTRCSSSPSASSSCCCCTSRSRSRAWPTRPRCSPSGWRCSRSGAREPAQGAERVADDTERAQTESAPTESAAREPSPRG